MIGLRSLPMDDQERLTRFESEMLPLMNDAYNLARWLVQNDQDAHDMVQEAFLRAFRYFSGMRGATSKAWLLRIVRNVCYDHLGKRQMLSHSSDTNNPDLVTTGLFNSRPKPGDLERQIEAFIEHYNHRRTLHSPGHG